MADCMNELQNAEFKEAFDEFDTVSTGTSHMTQFQI